MTWVKICGTTNLEDALTAVDAGADAVGFVFYEKSPRRIDLETARQIAQQLPESVETIGVFVHGDNVDAVDIILHAGLTGTQSYFSTDAVQRGKAGNERVIGSSGLPPRARFLTALPMNLVGEDDTQIAHMASDFAKLGRNLPEGVSIPDGAFTFVLDSGDLRQPGGTGKTFDWKRAVPIAEGMRQGGVKLVVAGGLTPDNVSEAIAILKPWGVDVVSGVEASPGKKDPDKVHAFIKAVRDIDRKTS
jgi:phosphoribosylanthranilate isomerase